MQNAGQQYGQGGTPSHQSVPFGHSENTTSGGSITSSLRQFRKKSDDKHNIGDTPTPVAESHVARVAPHNHYPPANRPTTVECYRFPTAPQYQDFSIHSQVKFSEILEGQSMQDHDSPTVIQKVKGKEYMEMCNVAQPHLKQPYEVLHTQQPYQEANVHHHAQYIPKEPQVNSPYKPESHQYFPKEASPQQYPPHHVTPPHHLHLNQQQQPQSPHQKYAMPAAHQVPKYTQQGNDFLSKLRRINPNMARSIMSDHHLQETQMAYQSMDHRGMYSHQNQRYVNYPGMQTSPYGHMYVSPTHPSATYPNYPPSCNYARSPQMAAARYPPDRDVSPRRAYPDAGVPMGLNYGSAQASQKMSPGYHQFGAPEYAQHYQHRRGAPPVTQDYYQHCRPSQYLPHQMSVQELPEARVTVSDSIKQYIENWADEDTASEINQLENGRLCKDGTRLREDQSNETVYMINASDIQYLENGIPVVNSESGIPMVSENAQYIIKGLDSSTGMVRIIGKNGQMEIGEIVDHIKPDCMLANKPNDLNQRHQNDNPYCLPEKPRVVVHQNTVIQSSFHTQTAPGEMTEDPVKIGNSLPMITDTLDELNRRLAKESKKETVDKNCSPINLEQMEGYNHTSVICPNKALEEELAKIQESSSSEDSMRSMPFIDPFETNETNENVIDTKAEENADVLEEIVKDDTENIPRDVDPNEKSFGNNEDNVEESNINTSLDSVEDVETEGVACHEEHDITPDMVDDIETTGQIGTKETGLDETEEDSHGVIKDNKNSDEISRQDEATNILTEKLSAIPHQIVCEKHSDANEGQDDAKTPEKEHTDFETDESETVNSHQTFEKRIRPIEIGTAKRSRRIFSVDDIMNTIGNNNNKYDEASDRRHSIQTTEELPDKDFQHAFLQLQMFKGQSQVAETEEKSLEDVKGKNVDTINSLVASESTKKQKSEETEKATGEEIGPMDVKSAENIETKENSKPHKIIATESQEEVMELSGEVDEKDVIDMSNPLTPREGEHIETEHIVKEIDEHPPNAEDSIEEPAEATSCSSGNSEFCTKMEINDKSCSPSEKVKDDRKEALDGMDQPSLETHVIQEGINIDSVTNHELCDDDNMSEIASSQPPKHTISELLSILEKPIEKVKELVEQPKELVEQPKELVEQRKELVERTQELVKQPKTLDGHLEDEHPKEHVAKPKQPEEPAPNESASKDPVEPPKETVDDSSVQIYEERLITSAAHDQSEIQYQHVIRVEESSVLLHIAGELVEITVNTVNGKKVITVVPMSDTSVVDLNDNYEAMDGLERVDPSRDNDFSAESNENISEVIVAPEPEMVETTSEIIIGMDLSLEEEIKLDVDEPPILCTKAARKAYDTDLQIPSITTSEDVNDTTRFPVHCVNDKVSSTKERTEKVTKEVERRKTNKNICKDGSSGKSGHSKRLASKLDKESVFKDLIDARNQKKAKQEQREADEDFVPFKELVKARKLKKLKMRELKKSQDEKIDSTMKIEEIKKDSKHEESETEKKEISLPKRSEADEERDTKIESRVRVFENVLMDMECVAKITDELPSVELERIDFGIVNEKDNNRPEVSILSSNQQEEPSQEKSDKIKEVIATKETVALLKNKESREVKEIRNYKLEDPRLKDKPDGSKPKYPEPKKKLSLEEYNRRKRKLAAKENQDEELSCKKSKLDHPEESKALCSPPDINKKPAVPKRIRFPRPKSLDDLNSMKPKESKSLSRKLSLGSSPIFDWEETQSPKSNSSLNSHDQRFSEFRGLINDNKTAHPAPDRLKPEIEATMDGTLQTYKEQVQFKLSSLNIQIPMAAKSPASPPSEPSETKTLMQKFLKSKKLTAEEIDKIRKIISYKRLVQQIKQLKPTEAAPKLSYEIQRELEGNETKLHLRKVSEKRRKFRPRMEESESGEEEDFRERRSGDYSVVQANCLAGVVPKLIIKRKTEMPMPVVRLERLDLHSLGDGETGYVV